MLTHLSLFSGIGGLDLAAEYAGFVTVGQCEIGEFAIRVLQKHWPDVPRWRDIRELTASSFFAETGLRTVDCVSGGFPCQPHSLAGRRKASFDERDLWPEMRRVICEIKPRWVVDENVRGLLSSENGRFFRGILRDFASMRYDVAWGVISASAFGASHRRQRVFIVAHADGQSIYGVRRDDRKEVSGSGDTDGDPTVGNTSIPVFEQLCRLPSGVFLRNGKPCKPLITRNDDGFPESMDRNRALGNAVCPPQFFPIFNEIARIEKFSEHDSY